MVGVGGTSVFSENTVTSLALGLPRSMKIGIRLDLVGINLCGNLIKVFLGFQEVCFFFTNCHILASASVKEKWYLAIPLSGSCQYKKNYQNIPYG